jgi:RNA polymerase sigma-70 factor (ECF subfamily)
VSRRELEDELRQSFEAGDFPCAATRALEGFGPEIFGYLLAVTRSTHEAEDAFSVFSEDLWRGFAGFRWQSSFRTWAYTLARHALYRSFDREGRRGVPLSEAPLSQLEQRIREQTLSFLKTEAKDRFVELRNALDSDDRTLLVLRVDRQMRWEEVARVMLEEGEPTPEVVRRKAVALRKQFERVKERLRILAEEAGLLVDESP